MTQHKDPQRLLEQLFAAAPIGVAFLDRNLCYLRVNTTMAAINGSTPEKHIGRTVRDIVPELAPYIIPQYEALLESGTAVVDREVHSPGPDKKQYWLSSYFPVHNDAGDVSGICTIVQDITERKRVEAALESRSEFQAEFIASMPGLLLLLDEDGVIRHWNRHVQEVFKAESSELAGSRVVDYIHPDDRLSIRHAVADCMEYGVATTEARFVSRSGESLPMSGQGVRITLDGKPHICVQVSDITEKVRTRLALEGQLRFQSLVANLSASLLAATPANLMSVIEHSLPLVADYFDIDRVALWEFDSEQNLLVPTISWNASHVPPFSMDLTSDDFPDTAARIFAGKPIVFSSPEEISKTGAPSRKYFDEANLRSGMMIPVKPGGQVIAMIAMASFDRTIDFTEDDVQHGQVLAGVIAGALKRRQSEQELNEAFDHIAQLKNSLEAECTVLREEISLSHDHHEIIGQSSALKDVLYRAEQVAATDVTVLINGETGVGKELIARTIHRASRRHMNPMITINCAALPPTLIESELFGHERGAFTGADKRRAGRFEVADGGTLFLDEIGELPQGLQAKLLRVLQHGEFERLGSSTTLTSDVRIITATNRDLEKEVAAGRFREDLWYRLNVFPIEVPPLRDRPDDIPALVAFFLVRLGHKTGRDLKRVPQSVMKSLVAYSWPGNVRELENIIERGVITSTGDEFRLADPLTTRSRLTPPDARRQLADVEKEHILRVLQGRSWQIEGNDGAAHILGLNPSTLRARLRKHGIVRPKLR